jgi:SAM-dependent methyltransferase
MIGIARELAASAGLPSDAFEVGDARALPYPDASFDLACAVTVLSHVPTRAQVLQELARVTKPGGRVLIVDGDFAANQLEHPDRELTARIIEAWRGNVVDDPYLTRRLGPLLDAAGLQARSANGHVHVEAGRVDPGTSFILPWTAFAAQQAVMAGAVTESQAAAWVNAARDLNERNLLFGSVTFISIICDRP